LSLTVQADENKETKINKLALKMVSQSRPHNRELRQLANNKIPVLIPDIEIGHRVSLVYYFWRVALIRLFRQFVVLN
jgi:hypothetical protein